MTKYIPLTQFSHKGVPLREILQDNEKWNKEKRGQRADLIGANLNGADLRDAYLRNADLIKTNLTNANLKGSNLSEANLFGANLSGSDMNGANLRGANLTKADISEADLRGSDLSEANLSGAHLAWAKMVEANLSEAVLIEAHLRGVDLTFGKLGKAVLHNANMVGTRLAGAHMARASLSGANLNEACLLEAELTNANLKGADLSDADLEKAEFKSADLSNAILRGGNLIGSDLSGADLSGISIDDANLSGWIITGVRCTHIIHGEQKETIRFNPGEFEKKYTQAQKLTEIILNIPLTGSAYYIGKFIVRSINSLVGSPVIDLKAIEAIAGNNTKFIFSIFDEEFFEKMRKAFAIALKNALNKYFHDRPIEKDKSYLGRILVNPGKGTSSSLDTGTFTRSRMDTDPYSYQDQLNRHLINLRDIGEAINNRISSILV